VGEAEWPLAISPPAAKSASAAASVFKIARQSGPVLESRKIEGANGCRAGDVRVLLTGDPYAERGGVRCRHDSPTGSRASLGVVGSRDDLVLRVENLDQGIVVALVDFNQVCMPRHYGQTRGRGLGSEGLQGAPGDRGGPESTGAGGPGGPARRPTRQNDCRKKTPARRVPVIPRLRYLAIEAYTRPMIGVDDQAAPAAMPPTADVPAPVSDPVSHLSAVYRDYPGLRALILRRVRDPEVAADILQDAAVTTLEKLRRGEIAHPENVGGYL